MPWLELCRGLVRDIRDELERMPTREEREEVLGQGRGGDETTRIDAAAEQAAVRRLEALDVPGFTLVSEELGERVFGAGGPRMAAEGVRFTDLTAPRQVGGGGSVVKKQLP